MCLMVLKLWFYSCVSNKVACSKFFPLSSDHLKFTSEPIEPLDYLLKLLSQIRPSLTSWVNSLACILISAFPLLFQC